MKAYQKIIGIALTTALSVATFSTAADAGLKINGFGINGFSVNGLNINGLRVNGVRVNGFSVNGSEVNSVNLKGTPLQRLEVRGGELVAVLSQ
ncbi:MAG: hypothetical protein RMY36_012580 [Nostoc sp. SerVER01]|nr:hypothetical protein [Nostoc sp. SerVER01]MDZ8079570.1 hypothetical protein [Nostoc sp. DcaGUA01]